MIRNINTVILGLAMMFIAQGVRSDKWYFFLIAGVLCGMYPLKEGK